MIEQQLRDDPYAQEAFSKLLRQVIEEAEKEFDHPLKQHMLFREFEEQVEARRLDEIPDVFSGNKHAQAYYGSLKLLPEAFSITNQQNQDKWIELAFEVDRSVMSSVAENSINPQNIEADIRKNYYLRCSVNVNPLGVVWIKQKNCRNDRTNYSGWFKWALG